MGTPEILSARALITVCPAIRNSLRAAFRNMPGRDRHCGRGNIKNKPVNPGVRYSVPILHNKNETFGFCRQVSKLEWRTDDFLHCMCGKWERG